MTERTDGQKEPLNTDERIETIGKDDFVDGESADIPIREIAGKQGRVRRRGETERGSGAPDASAAAFGGPAGPALEPELVCDESGRLGWRVSIPGGRPIATPAIHRGRVLVGGGFGTHEFYALDAGSGELLWRIRTRDDGPTAATVANGFAVFNTESCTIYVVEVDTGRVVWEKWLGDPLLAQPAIHGSTLFMAYPDRNCRHWLAAFGLEDGQLRWKTELIADVISAPVVAEGSLWAASIDGTVSRIDLETGEKHWSIQHRATSAPWVHRGKVYLSLREEVRERRDGKVEPVTVEGVETVSLGTGFRRSRQASSRRKAEYLEYRAASKAAHAQALYDAGVGFASAPAAAKLHLARGHLGVGSVSSAWSFQGSRPEVFDDGIFSVIGDVAQRLELGTKKPLWRVRLRQEEEGLLGRALSPPAVTAERLYLTSAGGHLIALDRETGEDLWGLNVGREILTQPAVGEGKVLLGTVDGTLYAFEADDGDAAGWPMWGGGPGHNGAVLAG